MQKNILIYVKIAKQANSANLMILWRQCSYESTLFNHLKINSMISIKEAKQIRENFGFTHLVILGISNDGKQHVATHGKTTVQAKEAANMGNQLKKCLDWPSNLCNSKPLERICHNCSFWQIGYHGPGDIIEANMYGECMFNPEAIKRFEQDRACGNFEPDV